MILKIMEVIVMISKIEYKMINSPNNLKSLKAFYTVFANQLDNYSSLLRRFCDKKQDLYLINFVFKAVSYQPVKRGGLCLLTMIASPF